MRPAGVELETDMNYAAEEGAGGEHGGGAGDAGPGAEDHRGKPSVIVALEILDGAGAKGKIGRGTKKILHRAAIELSIGLGARAAHRRTLAAVEQLEMDPRRVGDAAHQPVERVDLADEMALADPADRGIAGHLSDFREVLGDEQGARAAAGSGGGRFAAGMTAADDDDIILLRRGNHIICRCRTRKRSFPGCPRRRRFR